MTQPQAIQMQGSVTQVLPRDSFLLERDDGSIVNAQKFRVELNNGDSVLAYLPVKRHYSKILPGDRVKVELTPYDLTKGRQNHLPTEKEVSICREFYHKAIFLTVS